MINEIIRGIVAGMIPELGECLPLGHVSCIAPGAGFVALNCPANH